MGKCIACGLQSKLVSRGVGACAACIRSGSPAAIDAAKETHHLSRTSFELPADPPRAPEGVSCTRCARACCMKDGNRGYCGIRMNIGGRLTGGNADAARVQFYHDPLPTNCVADWVCPGGSNCGYPTYSYRRGPELGYRNLAVFYESCSFDCLFCQNFTYRKGSLPYGGISAQELAYAVDATTTCICYFGGDPGPQVEHALAAARLAREKRQAGILRICWETNGSENPRILDEMLEISLRTGGCVKFDLKAFDDNLHHALCGISNARTFANFQRAAERVSERADVPLLIASTLLIPGYVDVTEVSAIARFIAAVNPRIPYALLGFHPCFMMRDLPFTSLKHTLEAEDAARAAGLESVRIGNRHILRGDY